MGFILVLGYTTLHCEEMAWKEFIILMLPTVLFHLIEKLLFSAILLVANLFVLELIVINYRRTVSFSFLSLSLSSSSIILATKWDHHGYMHLGCSSQ